MVQRHRATRLHYDFRLEIDGVLVSWAVPKGPTLDPSVRRMAVHVEDHPLEYFDFEGVIPARQYGAGDVIVWDWGTWGPEEETPDPGAAVRDGELKFRLHGEKLGGRYTIVRTGRSERRRASGEEGEGDPWLLIKKRDEAASAGWDAEDHPHSVKTGRTNDDVKAKRDAVWVSKAPAADAEIDLAGAIVEPTPDFIPPMLATLTDRAFSDPDWLFEIKWDGYRIEAVVRDGTVRLWTRNGNDGATYFGDFLSPPTWIEAQEAIVDGEIVAIGPDGRPDFGLLQEAGGRRTRRRSDVPLVYQAFDLLHLDGRSLLAVPLEDRKRLLRSVLREQDGVKYAGHLAVEGLAFYRAAEEQGLEGIIAKHRRSHYEPGRRSSSWLKIKVRPEQELVVGGYLPGEGTHTELGALIVGVYEDAHLRYAGRVGSGIDTRTRAALREELDRIRVEQPPFDPAPDPKGDLREARWADPRLVIRAEFSNWTRDDLVRQASFKGIERDKDPRTVVRERARPVSEAREEAEQMADEEPPAKTPRRRATASATSSPAAPAPNVGGLPQSATAEELAALASMGPEGLWRVGGQDLKLTNLDKVLFPPARGETEPVTKRELVRYFALIAPAMLPHLAERALNLHRFPNGSTGSGFWQKDIPERAPTWLRRWHESGVDDRDANDHLVADQVASLAWLANQAAFEVHAWTSKIDAPDLPTYALIDIDPGERTSWDEVLVLARLYRTALAHLGVRAYPKLTGRRGIQAWMPIRRGYSFADTSRWIEGVSRAVGAAVPDLVSWEWAKAARRGRARLDYTQNAPIKTLVAPYAVRPADGAPVSAPITWDELDDPDLRPDRWTIRTLPARVRKVGDLFAGVLRDPQELPPL